MLSLVRGLRKILEGMPGVGSYIDDIVIYSDSWEDHIKTLKELFSRLRKARITARPTSLRRDFSTIDRPPKERKSRTYPVERGTGACILPFEGIPVAGASPEASRFEQAVCVTNRRIRSWCGGCATSGK